MTDTNQQIPTYTLTSVLRWSTKRGVEIGVGFQSFSFEFQQFLNVPKEKKEEIFMQVIETEKKLGKVAFALDNYEKIERTQRKKILKEAMRDKSSVNLIHAALPVELEGTVEEFLSQTKSTLDIAVKILKPIFGINLKTFGDSGEQVRKALQRQVPKNQAESTRGLIELIEGNKHWMEILRKYRTDTQHFSNIKLIPMAVAKEGEKYTYHPPRMAHGQDLHESLCILYENLFTFLQDFFAHSQQAVMFGGLSPTVTSGEGMARKFAVGILESAIKKDGTSEEIKK